MNVHKRIRIGTRGSDLAILQAQQVATALQEKCGVDTELVIIKTMGDREQNKSLTEIGGEGIFTTEITDYLRKGKIDFAVHSCKDVPVDSPKDLFYCPVLTREKPFDVLVSKTGDTLNTLPERAKIGTSSLRRAAQLKRILPQAEIIPIRGNISTRIRKLYEECLDAVILAYAGMKRLGFESEISEILPVELIMPAVGQGALIAETLFENTFIINLITMLTDEKTKISIEAERAFLKELHGGCKVPVAAFTWEKKGELYLTGRVIAIDGNYIFEDSIIIEKTNAENAGMKLARNLIQCGAGKVLEEVCSLK